MTRDFSYEDYLNKSRARHPSQTGRVFFEEILDTQIARFRIHEVDEAEFERMLREKYEPILSEEDYAKLRERCGLGPVIEGEVCSPVTTVIKNSRMEIPPTK